MAALDARSLLTHETILFPDAPYSAGVGDIVRTVGGLKSEWWAPSDQNDGRLQIGIGGRLTSGFASLGQLVAGIGCCTGRITDSLTISTGVGRR